MPIYELRYFFDYGSGICLWSANVLAREKFGYAVEFDTLALPIDLKTLGHGLIREYDTSLNWDSPSDPSPWPFEAWVDFGLRSEGFVARLRDHMGPQFFIRDEFKPPEHP